MRLGGEPSLFPAPFVTNESSKESWRREEHGLFVFEREFQRCTGEQAKVVKLREGRLTVGGGELGSVVKIEVLMQPRPPDRFQTPPNRCFICACLPTLL